MIPEECEINIGKREFGKIINSTVNPLNIFDK